MRTLRSSSQLGVLLFLLAACLSGCGNRAPEPQRQVQAEPLPADEARGEEVGAAEKPVTKHQPMRPVLDSLEAATRVYEAMGAKLERDLLWGQVEEEASIPIFTLNEKTKDEDLKMLPLVSFRFGLNLRDTRITGVGLSELAVHETLTWLSVPGDFLGGRLGEEPDEDLKELAKLKNLTSLSLVFRFTGEEGMRTIGSLSNLVTLNAGSGITDANLKEISRLKNLRNLKLIGSEKITAEGLGHLAKLTKLSSLDLSHSDINDNTVKRLSSIQSISSLNLKRTKITDASLRELSGLKKLRSLNLNETGVTLEGLDSAGGFDELSALHLYECEVSDHGMKVIGTFKRG